MVWFPCIYFVHCTAPGRPRRSRGERICDARQPRPQGFSLKKWVGPTHFSREKPWGRGWTPASLPVHELLSQGCAVGQGVVFNLSVLNRVSKQSISRLHIQVRVSSQTKGLERGWKRGARLERDAKKPLTRACEILKLRYADFEKKSQLFCSC